MRKLAGKFQKNFVLSTQIIVGMSCASSANNIEEAIRSVPGVSDCNVNFSVEHTIQCDRQRTNLETIQAAINAVGYSSYPLKEEMITAEDDAEKNAHESELRTLTRKIFVVEVQ